MRRLRRLRPGEVWDVTVRCHRSEFRLVPTEERRELMGFWLGKAQALFPGIQIHAITQMSNHLHAIVRDTASQLSDFMRYFLGYFAKSLNRLDSVRGAVFERRFTAIAIVDDAAVAARIAYAITNPVKAHLVRSHRNWTGLCRWSGGEQPTRETFTYFHDARYRRAKENAKSSGGQVIRSDFIENSTLEIVPFTPMSEETIRAAIEALESQFRRASSFFLGMKRVLRSSPFSHPSTPKRSPAPLCLATCREARDAFVDGWCRFVAAFREASAAFRSGIIDVCFPLFSFRPGTALIELNSA